MLPASVLLFASFCIVCNLWESLLSVQPLLILLCAHARFLLDIFPVQCYTYMRQRICRCGGIGRRLGLKIRWDLTPVPVRARSSVPPPKGHFVPLGVIHGFSYRHLYTPFVETSFIIAHKDFIMQSHALPRRSRTPRGVHGGHHFLQAVGAFCRANAVFLVALAAAVVTSCIVPPDAAYLGYFDFGTLACLFSTLAVVNALRRHRFFTILAEKIVCLTGNLRICVLSLVWITFIGSMIIANDMALLTFLPLGCYILVATGNERYMAMTFILQNAAANLGGMLTPFGNPQNLYLYSHFEIPTGAFMLTMLVPFLVSMTLVTVACLIFFPRVHVEVKTRSEERLPPVRITVYLILFLLVILAVFRVMPHYIPLALIVVTLLFMDRGALRQVDYPLLLTFVCFFIFAGNMVRIPAVAQLFSSLLERAPLVVATLSCQVISNVPSAILLSGFTNAWRPLLLGVNIGGVGTLISSLASLITFRTYLTHNPGRGGKYLALFSLVSFTFLGILLGLCMLLV